jgi:hypothetical protein
MLSPINSLAKKLYTDVTHCTLLGQDLHNNVTWCTLLGQDMVEDCYPSTATHYTQLG